MTKNEMGINSYQLNRMKKNEPINWVVSGLPTESTP
jgi:hypothetical protein